MALNLDLSDLRLKGRAVKAVGTALVRELQEEDLEKLQIEKGIKPPPLERISQRHKQLARAKAAGMTNSEAAALTGYSKSRISILMGDDAFIELVHGLSKLVDEEFVDVHGLLADLSVDALHELHDRLADDAEQFSNTMLLELVTKTVDRTGHGPSSTSTNINVGVNMADRLQAARERVNRFKEPEVINGEVKDVTETK